MKRQALHTTFGSPGTTMKLKHLLEMATENPALLEYTLNLSEYFAVPDERCAEHQIVTDFPILGIVAHEEDKELRFVMKQSDVRCIEQSRDRILWILRASGFRPAES
jgi:hypothetical protein